MRLTYEALQDLVAKARSQIEPLFALADGCALLDMLQAFTEVVSRHPAGFVRPVLLEQGALVLKGARHPVVASSTMCTTGGGFTSNDLAVEPAANFLLLTGPNGSGKTVLVKQAAMCVVMAQVGMLVPAKQAQIPLRDRLIARMGHGDDMQYNTSSFRGEMRELAYLTANITSRSLVLVDELGKSTGHIDGISLAFSAAEWLLATPAITLYITHFPQLTLLPRMYPNARCIHMRTAASAGITFLHSVGDGPSAWQTGYGIEMARSCGFPRALVRRAEALQSLVKRRYPLLVTAGAVDPAAQEVARFLENLLLLGASSMKGRVLRRALESLLASLPDTAREALRHTLHKRANQRGAVQEIAAEDTDHLPETEAQLQTQAQTQVQVPTQPSMVSPEKCHKAVACRSAEKEGAPPSKRSRTAD